MVRFAVLKLMEKKNQESISEKDRRTLKNNAVDYKLVFVSH